MRNEKFCSILRRISIFLCAAIFCFNLCWSYFIWKDIKKSKESISNIKTILVINSIMPVNWLEDPRIIDFFEICKENGFSEKDSLGYLYEKFGSEAVKKCTEG